MASPSLPRFWQPNFLEVRMSAYGLHGAEKCSQHPNLTPSHRGCSSAQGRFWDLTPSQAGLAEHLKRLDLLQPCWRIVLGSKPGCRTQVQPTTYASRVNGADSRGRLCMIFAFSCMCRQNRWSQVFAKVHRWVGFAPSPFPISSCYYPPRHPAH